MSVRPKTYISKGKRRIRAIKITEKNYTEVLDWSTRNGLNVHPEKSVALVKVSAGGDESQHRVKLCLQHQGFRAAYVGDYIAVTLPPEGNKIEDWTLFVLKKDLFEGKYTEVKA